MELPTTESRGRAKASYGELFEREGEDDPAGEAASTGRRT